MIHKILKFNLLPLLLFNCAYSMETSQTSLVSYSPFGKFNLPKTSKLLTKNTLPSFLANDIHRPQQIQYTFSKKDEHNTTIRTAYFFYHPKHIDEIAKSFGTIPELQVQFNLDAIKIDHSVFDALLSLHPQKISFINAFFDEIDIQCLKSNPNFAKLKNMEFYECMNVGNLIKYPDFQEKLRVYSLTRDPYKDDNSLTYLKYCSSLEAVNFGQTDEHIGLVAQIAANKNIRTFFNDLAAGISPKGFMPFLENTNLEKMEISLLKVTSADEKDIPAFFNQLSQFKNLRYLHWSQLEAPEIFYEHLAEYLSKSNLKTFIFSYYSDQTTLKDWTKIIQPLKHITTLRHLSITGFRSYGGKDEKSGLTDEAVPYLAELFKANSAINKLDFGGNLLTNQGYQTLLQGMSPLKLTKLNLTRSSDGGYNRGEALCLDAETMIAIPSFLKNQPHLRVIGLGGLNLNMLNCEDILKSIQNNTALDPKGEGDSLRIDMYVSMILDRDISIILNDLAKEQVFQGARGHIKINLANGSSSMNHEAIPMRGRFRIMFDSNGDTTQRYDYWPYASNSSSVAPCEKPKGWFSGWWSK